MKPQLLSAGRAGLLLPLAFLAGSSGPAAASAVYLTTNSGDIYRYESVSAMASQTGTVASGTLVASFAAYGSDQGTTMDLSTGTVYRVTGGGDVVSYASLTGYLTDSGGTTVATGVFSGSNSLNGISYDGGTGGFFAIGGGAAGNAAQGDLIQWANSADFLGNSNRTVTPSAYNGNLFNFYDPEARPGTTFGATGFPATAVETRYYQSAGTGRLEGWATLADYIAGAASQGNKRVHLTGENVFGGSSTAFGSATVDAASAFVIPEPGSAALVLGTLPLFLRRRRTV